MQRVEQELRQSMREVTLYKKRYVVDIVVTC